MEFHKIFSRFKIVIGQVNPVENTVCQGAKKGHFICYRVGEDNSEKRTAILK